MREAPEELESAPPEKRAQPSPDPPARGQVDRGALLKRAESEPGIQKLLETFGAQVVDIRPLQPSPERVTGGPDSDPVEDAS